MAHELALRVDAHLLQRLLPALPSPLRHDICRRYSRIFISCRSSCFGGLGRDDAEDDVLVRGEMEEPLEGARLHRILHQIVGLGAEVTEDFGGCAVVAAFKEVLGANEVTCVKVLYQRFFTKKKENLCLRL